MMNNEDFVDHYPKKVDKRTYFNTINDNNYIDNALDMSDLNKDSSNSSQASTIFPSQSQPARGGRGSRGGRPLKVGRGEALKML